MKLSNKNISRLILIFGVFFCIGVISNILLKTSGLFLLLFISILVFSLLIFYIKYLKYVIISILILFSGYFITDFRLEYINSNLNILKKVTHNFTDKKLDITAKVLNLKSIKESGNTYSVRVISISSDKYSFKNKEDKTKELEIYKNKNKEGKIEDKDKELVTRNIKLSIKTPSNIVFKPGEIIQFTSRLEEIEDFIIQQEGKTEDKYVNYHNIMLAQFIYARGYINTAKKIKLERNIFFTLADNIREYFIVNINKLYPEDKANFIAGILVGERRFMSEELKTDFNRSGLTHIIAVSGFNITILIVFISLFLRFLPRFLNILGLISFVSLFVIIVGFETPVLRAAIMGLISAIFIIYGFKIRPLFLVIITAIGFVIYNPLVILYDVSFMLSFLAVLGILTFYEYLNSKLFFLTNVLAIRDSISLTISAMVFTFPITFLIFNIIPLIAPISNVLAVPFIPMLMLTSFLSVIFNDFSIYINISYYLGVISYMIADWILIVVNILGNLKYSVLEVYININYVSMFSIFYISLLLFLVLVYGIN